MSKFYTVDRSNNIDQNMVFSLQKNYSDHKIWTVQDIYDEEDAIARIEQLYPEGLSFHGIQYLIKECLGRVFNSLDSYLNGLKIAKFCQTSSNR
ncbi:hypothetical protein [Psychrobacter aquimaris]|uniref:hypothetical protein n=1 Tax=Psychrobacter aquimaris TaxID=292733 RepID=UPI0039C5E1A3